MLVQDESKEAKSLLALKEYVFAEQSLSIDQDDSLQNTINSIESITNLIKKSAE